MKRSHVGGQTTRWVCGYLLERVANDVEGERAALAAAEKELDEPLPLRKGIDQMRQFEANLEQLLLVLIEHVVGLQVLPSLLVCSYIVSAHTHHRTRTRTTAHEVCRHVQSDRDFSS